MIAKSAKLADAVFSAAEGLAFRGDAVETWSIPAWALQDGADWLPDLERWATAEHGRMSSDARAGSF